MHRQTCQGAFYWHKLKIRKMKKKIVMIKLPYPYGKPSIYRGGATFVVSAQFYELGYDVQIIDLNIYREDDGYVITAIKNADIIGVSVTGSPYIPSAIAFCRDIKATGKPILVGGQVIEYLSKETFQALFKNTNAIQDTSPILEGQILPSPYSVDLVPVWQSLDERTRIEYLKHEMSLFVSQGCLYRCAFCAAKKNVPETFRNLEMFRRELEYVCQQAEKNNIKNLEVYASSLDLFQSALIEKSEASVMKYLAVFPEMQKKYPVEIKIRCLCTVKSFLSAEKHINNFAELVRESGLWSIGFGVDGSDAKVFRSQKKQHNSLSEVAQALTIAEGIGLRSEVLLVLGFSSDTFKTMLLNLLYSFRYVFRWSNTTLRPYLAKEYVPGNDLWNERIAKQFAENPELFMNLDFCAFGSKFTHPRFVHRWYSNIVYGLIIVIFAPFGRCLTSPLLPRGTSKMSQALAEVFNRLMPADY